MKSARIIVLGVALLAGGLAFMLSGRTPAPVQQVVKPAIETVDVLVAKKEIGLGMQVQAGALGWQTWPADAANASFIQKKSRPNALEDFKGAIARAPFVAGEPIRDQKMIRANGSGFMSAILTPGMRAISTDISPESGVGGFILPNDRVDVILSKREKITPVDGPATEIISSQVVLSNLRVLAIDQAPKEKDGQNAVLGKTATLEMAPDDVQILARARISGTLSLALRSIADGKTSNDVVSHVDSKLVTVYRGAVIADVLNCNPLCTRR